MYYSLYYLYIWIQNNNKEIKNRKIKNKDHYRIQLIQNQKNYNNNFNNQKISN